MLCQQGANAYVVIPQILKSVILYLVSTIAIAKMLLSLHLAQQPAFKIVLLLMLLLRVNSHFTYTLLYTNVLPSLVVPK